MNTNDEFEELSYDGEFLIVYILCTITSARLSRTVVVI